MKGYTKQLICGKKSVFTGAIALTLFIAAFLVAIVSLDSGKSYAAPTVYYASPTGSGSTCSLASPCSLTGVQAKVRSVSASMTDDIIVNLLGGTYDLSQTLVFSPSLGDSGTNGHDIIYQADGYGTSTPAVPILSGGQTVTGWTLHDSVKNIWKANVGSLQTRQLFVDGVRAFRARTTGGIPGTVTKTATGYTTNDTSLQSWAQPGDIEMVYHDGDGLGNWLWAEPRCPVASITGNASTTTITMAQPCFDLAKSARGGNLSLPTWIENNYKAIAQEGQFYLDRTTAGAHVLYYKPRSGQNLATASVVAPKLEQLVRGDGTLTNPIQHVQLKGLTFAYATWLAPNASQGFPETSYNKYNNTTGPESQQGAAVSFYAGQHLLIEGSTFRALGGAGLNLDEGSRNNAVIGSQFYDISGNGIQIGNVDTTQPSVQELVTDNLIKNNYIHDVGREYPGAYGIWNAITQNTTVEHNTIAHLPRGGIATNYQYSTQPPSATSGNKFNYNKIYDYMNNIRDGGGFDTNGTHNGVSGIEPNSTLIGNVFYDNHNNYGQIYFDIWASGYVVKNNVAYSSASLDYNTIDFILQPCCNTIRYNFFDQDNSYKFQLATDMALGNYMLLPISAMPASILQNAGLEPAYRYMLPAPVPPSDTQAPSAPGGASASAVGSGPSVTISWGAAADNVGVTGYEVNNGKTVMASTTGTGRSALIDGLSPGGVYHFTVRARDAAGNLSAPSNSVLVTVQGSPDLVGHWTMDDSSGTIASDTSGSANNGTIAGTASWIGAKLGWGLSFNGTNNSVNVGNAQILSQDRHSFTVATWFKSTSGEVHQRMVSKGNWGNTAGYFLWYEAGALAFGVGGNAQQSNATLATSSGGFNDGNWHHVAAVVDRSAQTIQIFVDGVARSLTKGSGYCGTVVGGTTLSIDGCSFLAASSNDPFTIGSYNGSYEFFSGSLDEVRVHSRALSASDIRDLMTYVGHWRLDGGAEDDTNTRTFAPQLYNTSW
ncbi:LamG-like jellyroll fold domain-containing protein [Cohnella silvisoli]|uniref:Right-handed parallel beta-helix repeat-containing protein n=1 Tax=Cohnella silvisoli TaxID=2873699 RepID=A0ABV1KM25_9BACL|nr:LamG-like jellyroll fold domain-containing protein [Cohnella silvisoli]MCD9020664.1 right-handed parallel beta-helix repeat-containing protein [Cohnella silvisoli]